MDAAYGGRVFDPEIDNASIFRSLTPERQGTSVTPRLFSPQTRMAAIFVPEEVARAVVNAVLRAVKLHEDEGEAGVPESLCIGRSAQPKPVGVELHRVAAGFPGSSHYLGRSSDGGFAAGKLDEGAALAGKSPEYVGQSRDGARRCGRAVACGGEATGI